jgi:hypothetical protein
VANRAIPANKHNRLTALFITFSFWL